MMLSKRLKRGSTLYCMIYNIIPLQVTTASISSFARPEVKGELVKLIKYPIYFEYTDGVIGRVYTSEVESIFCANVKKGLLSLFQLQETEGQRDEVPVDLQVLALRYKRFREHDYQIQCTVNIDITAVCSLQCCSYGKLMLCIHIHIQK